MYDILPEDAFDATTLLDDAKSWLSTMLYPRQLVTVPVTCRPLVGFTMTRYKNCMLVKHQSSLLNKQGVSNIFESPGFSRPMYWNNTLHGWVASCRDKTMLLKLGVTVEEPSVPCSYSLLPQSVQGL